MHCGTIFLGLERLEVPTSRTTACQEPCLQSPDSRISGHFPWRHFGSNLPRCQATAALVFDTAVVACARTQYSVLRTLTDAALELLQPALQTEIGCPRYMNHNALRCVSVASKDRWRHTTVCRHSIQRKENVITGNIFYQYQIPSRQRDGAWRTTMTTAPTPFGAKSAPPIIPDSPPHKRTGLAVACSILCRHRDKMVCTFWEFHGGDSEQTTTSNSRYCTISRRVISWYNSKAFSGWYSCV
jgi:hypothetical protein